MVKVWSLEAARRMRGGERRGRECPLTESDTRLEAREVVTPDTAPASRDWRTTGPEGKMMGWEVS